MVVVVDPVSATPLRPRHPEKVNRPDALSPPKPDWIRVRAPNTRGYADTRRIVKENGLVTVCEEAGCPNIGECWDKKHATFMIMGDTCTRACAFCNVTTGLPGALDPDEPARVAEATAMLALAHVVVTSVDRDDLADGGAAHFAAVIRALRAWRPLFRLDPALAESQGARSPSFHQVRHHGGARRDTQRSAAGDGRSARRGCRFPHHRTISAAKPQTSRGRTFCDARRICRLRDHRLCERLPGGLGVALDPLVPSCGGGFRATAGRASPLPTLPRMRGRVGRGGAGGLCAPSWAS